MDITTQQLRCFVAVAEHLHFGRAAQSLHLSPSTVSENIAVLEKRIRRPLLQRTPRHVTLTAAGTELLPLARQALAAMDEVVEWSGGGRRRTAVRVGLMVSSARFRATMSAATAAMPEVTWEIKHLGLDGAYRALADDEVDCVFVTEAGEAPKDVRAQPLWNEGCVVVVRDDHRLANRPAITRADLSGETLIAVRDSETSSRWLHTLIGDTDDVVLRPIAHSFEEVLELCSVGAGINIAGESAAESYARPGIHFIPFPTAPRLTTYLCLPQRPNPTLVDFIDVVEHSVRDQRTFG
ncbi:LysR family transcriptional regulator [Gordonia sp. CPCC 205515]|uniref:LysR family transcriptional regulator n=1 Tax=Gordonia sp. CPCC 205515 TaxID=3140791 RepID=UPI003AF3958A